MNKILLFFATFLCSTVFAQKLEVGKTNFQAHFTSGNIPLDLTKIVDDIKSAGYSGGKLIEANVGFGVGMDLSVKKFQFGLDFLFRNMTKPDFSSKTNSLGISVTSITPQFGYNFRPSRKSKISLMVGPYFQEVSLKIKPLDNGSTSPSTLIDFLVKL